MQDLLVILGIASMSLIFVRQFGYKYPKPFSCELCMAFWITLFWYHSLIGIPFAFAAATTATLLNKYI